MSPSPPASPVLGTSRPISAPVEPPSDKPDDAMQLFIKTPSGTTTTLTVPPTTSIATVKSLVALQVPSAVPSATSTLTFAGRLLDCPEKLLSDYHIPPSSTLHLSLPSRASDDQQPPLDPSATASSPPATNLSDSATLPAKPAPPKLKTGTPGGAKRKGPRCAAAGCNALAQRIVGECGFCGGNFCGKHRLLESHACEGLDDCKKESKERNKERLESERTVMMRGLGV